MTSDLPLSAALPGTWLLESRIDVTVSGIRRAEPSLGEDPVALLMYDRAGHFAAQFMKRDRAAAMSEGAGGATNNTRARGGYDAYFGTYTVDDSARTVTLRLLGALSPENVGLVLTREMEVRGDELVIRLSTSAPDGAPVTRTLTWRRVGERLRPRGSRRACWPAGRAQQIRLRLPIPLFRGIVRGRGSRITWEPDQS